MILNLNKFQKITNLNFDLTDQRPIIYFLILVNENTPRYKRIKGQYIEDKNGNFVIDEGFDLYNLKKRILIYIGETINSLARIHEHYYAGKKGKSRNKAKGIGNKFNYIRVIKGFKRFEYDSVRIHEETKLVRKYLPQENQSARISEKSRLIMLNSNGKITPQDVFYPYKIHGRDYYKAFKAWEAEDISIIEGDIISAERKNKVGIVTYKTHNNSFYSKKNGVKIPFHQWFKSVVICRHKKQVEAMRIWRKNISEWIKLYAPEYHDDRIIRDREYKRSRCSDRKLQYDRAYRKMVRNNKQMKGTICT
jgi:hypothetical protein